MKNSDRLYELLPAVYRQRDANQGYPLRAVLQVIAEQVEVIEEDIEQLYENWFIETCEDWVVPYIGELISYRQVHEAGESGDPRLPQAHALNRILMPRRDVANTIRNRRRKGTLALLEELARDAAGWPARAVQFYKLLGWTQNINYPRPGRGRTADLRNSELLDLIDGPFDGLAHTVDIRRISSPRTQGRYNIPTIGLFVWRLNSYSVTQTPALCCEGEGSHCYTFSILSHDTQLYSRAEPETAPTHIAEEQNLPTPIRRRAFEKRIIENGRVERTEAAAGYYGEGKSLVIWAPGWPRRDAPQPVPKESIIPADLSGWHYDVPRDRLAVDPKLGRIAFPVGQPPRRGAAVSYHYGFSADIGGGEYERRLSQPAEHVLYRVGRPNGLEKIGDALAQWANEDPKPRSAVIEIIDSGVYTEPINIDLQENETLQIRAANRKRPVIRLLDYFANRPDPFTISGGKGSRLTLDGLLIAGRGVKVQGPDAEENSAPAQNEKPPPTGAGDLCQVMIRHCTLVPGWAVDCHCVPLRPGEASLELLDTRAHIRIERSILGPIEVSANRDQLEPVHVQISDSILDATGPDREALSGPHDNLAYVKLVILRSTVFGKIMTHAIKLAENCTFMGSVRVARRQPGCVRFSYVKPGSRTPRRFHCQPDLVEAVVAELVEQGRISKAKKDHAIAQERLRVEPQFNNTHYGSPVYGQLAAACAGEIQRGADDESEMGAFHHLYQPQRAANLRARLEEYTAAGMQPGIIFAT